MRSRILLYIVLVFMPVHLFAQNVEFIENQGQWHGPFKYRASTGKGEVFLENSCFTYLVGQKDNPTKLDDLEHGRTKDAPILKYHAYKMFFENALVPNIVGNKPGKSYYNYFLGNDSTRWKSNIHPCHTIDYKELYKGIDLHISSDKGDMEYEFVVRPGANEQQIRLRFDGADGLQVKKGNLVIHTSVGDAMELKPYAYQYINDVKVTVPCNYVLDGNILTYSFPEKYDEHQTLVIDPVVIFATFTGSFADNWGFTATYDALGNFYTGGIAQGLGYPVSTGAFQTTYAGGIGNTPIQWGCDIAIIKYDQTLTNRIYATYIGGSMNERPHSMIVDTSNNLILAGRTSSTNYPITPSAFQTTRSGGWDIIVTKLNSTGTALLASTYIGGPGDDGMNYDSTEVFYGNLKHNYGDDARSEVQIDKAGNVYVTGCTRSAGFPTTANAQQTTLSGGQDAVVFKMNSTLSTLLYSTYIGGTSDDAGYVIAFNTSQSSFYVAGGTQGGGFPTTAGTLHPTYQGNNADGFVLKFQNSPPYTIQKGTYIGTSGYDQVYGIQVDAANSVYVMGQSIGGLFPVTAGVYSNPNSTQFVMKMDSSLTTDVFSTVYGNGISSQTNISPVAFLVDTCQNIYISGYGGNLHIPNFFPSSTIPASLGQCTNMPLTANAAQSTTDGFDFYFIVFGRNATTLQYATYMGSPGVDEHVDGGTSRFDKNGIVYQAICAGCGGGPFPTTPGVWSTTNNSSNCNEVALKINFSIGPVNALASPNPTSGTGCAPLFVQFSNLSSNGATYVWDFGDGSATTTTISPSHTYTAAGHYTVRLIASNSNACTKLIDTAYVPIIVDTGTALPAFTVTKVDSCGPYIIHINNTSQHGTAAATYAWDFGDGTNFTGTNPPNHTYSPAGSYTITLTMTDATLCTPTGTATQTLTFSAPVVAAASPLPNARGCVPFAVQFQNNSTNGVTYQWSFGDGSAASTAMAPTHTFTTAGSYTVRLITTNVNSCNKADTAYLTIVVGTNQITPKFGVVQPNSCSPYVAIFSDSTSGTAFTVYTWFFGDGSSYTGYTPPAHTYAAAGNYTVLLTLSDSTTCNAKDTLAKIIKFNGLKVAAGFTANDTVCVGTQATFTNTATNGAIYTYYFSNGQSTSGSATSTNYQFPDTGSYTIIQVVNNTAACNGTDTFKRSIYVTAGPVADFSFTPVIPVTNTPVSYTNLSVGAIRYTWEFGDNTTSAEVNPTHMFKKTGEYNTCLTAYNNLSCPSKLCKQVSADIQPLADLPTGFSPNGDGANDVLYVRGAAIQTLDLMIFNRWGQLVFETTDQAKGWDGTFNGKPQDMDAYAYVLRVTFIDGTTLQKKGNVTLLR